jgi:hypothetical protein
VEPVDPDLIDGHPLPFGTYAPWLKPLSTYLVVGEEHSSVHRYG